MDLASLLNQLVSATLQRAASHVPAVHPRGTVHGPE